MVLAVVLAFGCGKSETPGPDAGPTVDAGVDAGPPPPVCLGDRPDASIDAGWDGGFDFSCRGRTPSAGGQPELVITGNSTRAAFTRNGLPGVVLELLALDGTVLASTTSGDGGLYRLAYDAGCTAVAGEVRATSPNVDAGFYVSYAVPESPWRYDRSGLELVLFDGSARTLAAAVASVTLVDGTAVLAVTVEDCDGNPVEGAEVTTGDAGVVRYVGASGLPTMTLTRTGPTGDLVIFNLPGTSVQVTATRNGEIVGQRGVPLHANGATGTVLAP